MTSKTGFAIRSPDKAAEADNDLLAAAVKAARNAYAPYSHFLVGMALRARSGAIYAGANVENVSYPVGSCAETATLAAAQTAEGKALTVDNALVYAESGGEQQPCSPCGACRQRLVEFNPKLLITFFTSERSWITVPADELLPFAFRF